MKWRKTKILPEFDEATCITSIATHVYVSKHAILIAKLIGDSTKLSRFDLLHVELKLKDGKIEKSKYYEYKDVLATLQTKVLAESRLFYVRLVDLKKIIIPHIGSYHLLIIQSTMNCAKN